MELKRESISLMAEEYALLIVPYGIETEVAALTKKRRADF